MKWVDDALQLRDWRGRGLINGSLPSLHEICVDRLIVVRVGIDEEAPKALPCLPAASCNRPACKALQDVGGERLVAKGLLEVQRDSLAEEEANPNHSIRNDEARERQLAREDAA